MTPPSQWTRIDPAVHTPSWFRGKGVTFRLNHRLGGPSDFISSEVFEAHHQVPENTRHFLLHPPLPDPLEEEIEREAQAYMDKLHKPQYQVVFSEEKAAFIAGARAFLGRKA